jgi:hypothetical protein
MGERAGCESHGRRKDVRYPPVVDLDTPLPPGSVRRRSAFGALSARRYSCYILHECDDRYASSLLGKALVCASQH